MAGYFSAYVGSGPYRRKKLTIYYDRYTESHSLIDIFGPFDPVTQRDLCESFVKALNLALDRGRKEVRDGIQVALGLKLPGE